MSARGLSVKSLGFVGSAIDSLAAAQTPALFVLIGLTVKLAGNTPLVRAHCPVNRLSSSHRHSHNSLPRLCHECRWPQFCCCGELVQQCSSRASPID